MKTVLVLVLLAQPVFSAEEKRIYIANDDHTDYEWSATAETYRTAFLEMLDYYLDLADQTQENHPDHQSRFVCDGLFWIWVYEKNKTPQEFERLMWRVQSGHIASPMTTLACCYGGVPAEGILRGMYYAGELERRYGVRFRMAQSVENQTMPWGLASLWAGSGARYSWRGICGCDSKVPDPGNREHDIYSYTGPDGQRILMKWNSMLQGNQSMGGYAEAYKPSSVVEYVSSNSAFQARYPFPVIGCFGHGWDNIKTTTDQFVTTAKNLSNSSRRVIVSNQLDFFEDFETNHGDDLPTVAYSFGNEWELYCAYMAEVSARVKRSIEKLRPAEAMAAVVSVADRDFPDNRIDARRMAFMNLGLFWEHDWLNKLSTRKGWQREIGTGITEYVDALHSDAVTRLGALIGGGSEKRFFAFNPLGWSRTDFADFPMDGSGPIHVVEVSNGNEVPSQGITVQGEKRLRILARDVPAAGYKVYEVRDGPGDGHDNAATFTDGILENEFYRVTVAPRGAITSLIRKGPQEREFSREVEGRFLNDLGSSGGILTLESSGPVSVTVKAESSQPLPHTSRITLYGHGERIDIQNEITENFLSVYYGFGFNIDSPLVRHEEVGAIATARFYTEGGHYATRNARYDWLTLNHFADMSGIDGAGVTLSNADCYYFRLGKSTVSTLDTSTPLISPLVGGQVNGPAGIPGQGGDEYFLQRFSLRIHSGYDQVASMRFALEHQNPLVCGAVTGTDPQLPQTQFSLLSVSNPAVLLWALKPAEDGVGRGLALRLWNLSESPQEATIQLLPSGIGRAWTTTHLETDEKPEPVTEKGIQVEFLRQQIRTFRLVPEACGEGNGDCGSAFIRGDSNGDGEVDISDPVWDLFYLFGEGRFLCLDSQDTDDDGEVDLTDIIYRLGFLFTGGPPPPAPFPACGFDLTADPWKCTEAVPACS